MIHRSSFCAEPGNPGKAPWSKSSLAPALTRATSSKQKFCSCRTPNPADAAVAKAGERHMMIDPVTGFSSRHSAPLLKRGVLLPSTPQGPLGPLLQPIGRSANVAEGNIFLKLFTIMSIFISIESLCPPRGCLAVIFHIITESYWDGRAFIRAD